MPRSPASTRSLDTRSSPASAWASSFEPSLSSLGHPNWPPCEWPGGDLDEGMVVLGGRQRGRCPSVALERFTHTRQDNSVLRRCRLRGATVTVEVRGQAAQDAGQLAL